MKNTHTKKLSILSLILALLVVLPLAVQVPALRAEGISTWDKASYAELEDLSPEIVQKYVETDPDQGISMDLKFNLDVSIGYGSDTEQAENVVIGGTMNLLGNADHSATAKIAIKADIAGDAGEYLADVYVTNDDQNPDDLLVTVYTNSAGESDTERSYSVIQEVAPRDEIDQLAITDMDVDEFNNFATMKVVEDQGDKVDVVTLLSVENFTEVVGRVMNEPYKEMGAEIIDVEAAKAAIADFSNQIGVSELVIPVWMTLEKETGHLISVKIDKTGIQEMVDHVFGVAEVTEESSSFPTSITINDFSFEIDNVQYGVNEPVVIPDEVLEALEALKTAEDVTE